MKIRNYKCPICKRNVDIKGLCKSCEELIIKDPPFNYDFIEEVDDIYIASNYFGVMREIILNFKFNDKIEYAEIIAEIMIDNLLKSKEHDYVVTFVPMHIDKLRVKGYNHGEILAKIIADKLDLKFMEIFEKVKDTKDQHGLIKDERIKNLEDSFRIKNYTEKILIVDDIITTGTTIRELAKLAKKNNIKKVTALIAATKIA